jgi:hypothetical protein
LEEADYLKTRDAHRNREQIEATGVLQHDEKTKVYELQKMQGFRVPTGLLATGPIGDHELVGKHGNWVRAFDDSTVINLDGSA